MKKRIKSGFTLIELMTVLIIVIMLASVAFPIYQEYITRAQMAETEVIFGSMENSQRAYYYANGTFLSTPPNPSIVPGMNSLGELGVFGASTAWTTLVMPVGAGSEVAFSYQSFAGQTPPGSTEPVVNSNLFAPGTDMDLERSGTYTASLEIPMMRQYALRGFEFDYQSLGFNMSAFAQRGTLDGGKESSDKSDKGDTSCIEACKGDPRCEAGCGDGKDGKESSGKGEKGDEGKESSEKGEKGDEGKESSEKGDEGKESSDKGDSDGGDDGSQEDPVIPCASFGVSKPTDFGVQEGVAGYSWVVMTASGNLSSGTTCSLGVKVITVRNGEMSSRGLIQINPGE
ncbi:MAG: prepilin-type N-terminal cleavage/methylation domain-containing protein [Proteobacteria bacterium]|nr:prepilin-type N-terminal cleavage/methylation domain-containing protein [Pseudomonadota bacterium]